ncbi:hypothetical protein KDL29_03900 [bacterium]|nr:hypothetical protein [bacterium]
MDIAAMQILQRMEQQLHLSQRNMRLYFAIGGGLLATGLFNGLPIEMYMISTLAQMLIFLLGSIIGMACGSKLQKSVLPVAIEHVRSLLIDAMLMAQLIDSPAHELPGNSRRGLLNSSSAKENTSMGGRLDWIVNNWSVLAHRLGYHPLPQLMQRLHLLYLALIVLVPLSAVLLHSVSLLLVLGSVYVLGLSLDSLECDAVRTVLLDSLLADEE